MTSAVLAGSTGQVGSSILALLLPHPSISTIHAFTRRPLPNPTSSPKLHAITSATPVTWPTLFPPSAQIMFSGLATTRAAAGGLAGQRAIDLDLNLALARAAKEAGVDTYVLISGTGADSSSMFGYMAMKGELEDGVRALGFAHTVFVRPGFISGERSNRAAGIAEVALRWMARGLGAVSPVLKDAWAQDGETIARAAVVAGLKCVEGREEGVWEVGQGEIVRLGKE